MQELTLEQTEQVGGGIAAAFGFLAFWAIAEIGAHFGWWEKI